jgi:hypothetical protein
MHALNVGTRCQHCVIMTSYISNCIVAFCRAWKLIFYYCHEVFICTNLFYFLVDTGRVLR